MSSTLNYRKPGVVWKKGVADNLLSPLAGII